VTSQRDENLIQSVICKISGFRQGPVHAFRRSQCIGFERYNVGCVKPRSISLRHATANGRARLAETSKSVANRMFFRATCRSDAVRVLTSHLPGLRPRRLTDVFRILNCQFCQDSIQDFQLLVLHLMIAFCRVPVQEPQRELKPS